MRELSRRLFLKSAGVSAATLLLANRSALPAPKPLSTVGQRPFEMLVAGDSIVSGQGLQEKNKFYQLVKEWLRQDVFSGTRQVNLKVKAHSGSRIRLHEDELKHLLEAEDDIDKFYSREVNISFPSIEMQIDAARREYERPDAVNLIMLSGGITDVTVANLINPFFKEEKLRELIRKYCNEAMSNLLGQAAAAFPNAYVAVVGYFPIISTKSDVNKIVKFFLKTVKFPGQLQWPLTNDLSKQFMKIMRKKMAKNSLLSGIEFAKMNSRA